MGFLAGIRNFPEFIRVIRKGTYTGDAVILKSSFGKFEPGAELKDFIEQRKNELPDFSDIDFTTFPPGSFGNSYLQFMISQNLRPFQFSGRYMDILAKNYLPIYYASVHDFFHVLTGFDSSFAGEAGVWAFVAAQNISPQGVRAHRMAQMLFPIANPRQYKLIRRAGREGFAMGLAADPILTMDFRKEFMFPLNEVRKRYRISQA